MTHQKILTTYCDQGYFFLLLCILCVTGANLKLSAVPVVMVFTKLDVLAEQTRFTVKANHPNKDEDAIDDPLQKEIKRKLRETYLQPLRNVTGTVKIPHAVVSGEDAPRLRPLMLSSTS